MAPNAQQKNMEKQLEQLSAQVNTLAHSQEYNNKITEGLVQQVSGIGSDLKAFKQEMKPWLEAKVGLNLLWRWGLSIPIIIAIILGIKTFIGWLGFHR
jgi:hypothetical protein